MDRDIIIPKGQKDNITVVYLLQIYLIISFIKKQTPSKGKEAVMKLKPLRLLHFNKH